MDRHNYQSHCYRYGLTPEPKFKQC